MNTSMLIRASLNSVRKELAEVYPHLTEEMLGWAPAEGMRTIHGQFVEILGTEADIVSRFQHHTSKTSQEFDAPYWAIMSVEGIIEELNKVRATTLEVLEGFDESDLAAPIEISAGYAAYLELESVPAGELFRFLARHESYHSGQLFSYLWAYGDNPYKWN